MAKAKKHYSGIGGQAVLEGIMMKNKTRYAVAVRKPDGEIDVEISEYKGILGDSKIMKIPFVRGIFAFVDSLVLGTRTLNHSASFYEEEVTETKSEEIIKKVFKDKAENILVGFTTVLSIVLAVAIFMVLPYVITSQFLEPYIRNASLLAIIEGIMRIAIFVLYTVIVVASVIISAFIDNIPYVATMIPVIAGIAAALNIDATPLYFGLLSGATLGGNCTPVGASANITGIGILKKAGYTVKNGDFFKIGISFTIAAVVPAYIYIWLVFGI